MKKSSTSTNNGSNNNTNCCNIDEKNLFRPQDLDNFRGAMKHENNNFQSQSQFDVSLFPSLKQQKSYNFNKTQSILSNSMMIDNQNNIEVMSKTDLLTMKTLLSSLPDNISNATQNKQKLNFDIQTSVDEKNEEEIIFIESKTTNSSTFNDIDIPSIYNTYSSCTINNKDCSAILKGICELLGSYSYEIEYNINNNKYQIEGVIYMRHRPVYWLITIWSEPTEFIPISRVEFQKYRGDCIDFQHFWNDMLGKIQEKFGSKNVNAPEYCKDFENMFMPNFDFCEPMQYDVNELNNVNEQLHDDFHEIAIDALGLLCTQLENQDDLKNLVSNHEPLMKTLINSVLKHVDASHVRGGLIVLQLIVNSSESFIEQLIKQLKILDFIIPLLQHKQTLIRKHAIRLLSLLSQKEWCLTKDECTQIEQQLLKLQNEWNMGNRQDIYNDDSFISSKMFQRIKNRISHSFPLSSDSLNMLISVQH